jgi:hypothetical protein
MRAETMNAKTIEKSRELKLRWPSYDKATLQAMIKGRKSSFYY